MFQLANVCGGGRGELGDGGDGGGSGESFYHSTLDSVFVFLFIVYTLKLTQESFSHVPNKTYLLNNYDSDFLLQWCFKDRVSRG